MRSILALLLLTVSAVAQTATTPAPIALVCAYNSAVPSPADGQFFYVQCDSTGKIITSGSGGTPGGTTGQLQFNNAGSFGGGAGTAWDDTNRTLTITNAGATQSLLATYSELKFNRAGTAYLYNANAGGSLKVGVGSGADGITVASTGVVSFFSALSGSGAMVTTSTPLLDLSQTWNAGGVAFSALKLNVTDTASAAGSFLLDLQVGGTSKFNVDKSGVVKINGGGTMTWTSADSLVFSSTGGYQRILAYTLRDTNNYAGIGDSGVAGGTQVQLAVSSELGWTTGSSVATGTYDLRLARDAANTLALRNSTNAQTLNVYNTYTDASNYERGFVRFNSNVLEYGMEFAGTGASKHTRIRAGSSSGVYFNLGGADAWLFNSSGHFLANTDNTYDIGASSANRARNAYLAGKIVTGSTTLHETSVALTNGAAAATGTLTNAPAAGNPTKWFPINDNGTTRYVPAW